jgi:hypothetical protein
MRWFFYHFIVSRLESKDLIFFILVELRLHLVYSESAPIFFLTYEDSIVSIFHQGRQDIISDLQENKMQL